MRAKCEPRVVPIPEGEPMATLTAWDRLWAILNADRPDEGDDLTMDLWPILARLHARLVAFGVPIAHDFAEWMATRNHAAMFTDDGLDDWCTSADGCHWWGECCETDNCDEARGCVWDDYPGDKPGR